MNKLIYPAVAAGLLLAGGFALMQSHPVEAAKSHATMGRAADFALPQASNGKVAKLSDYKGKVRIVDFFATWCPPCRGEIPDFVALQKQYGKKGLQIIGVSVDQDGANTVKQFMKAHGMNYTVVMASDQTVADYGGIRGIPTTFVIDRDGNIVQKYVGATSKETFEHDIKALL